MQALAFQAPGEVEVVERPEPELEAPDDAVVRITATGVCGSDLHIFHGRVKIEPGFTIGHEYVGEVVAVGDGVTSVAVGDRVLGCFQVACGTCFFCRRGHYHKCDSGRTFGHGAGLGSLQGTQADMALVPHANLTLRRVPEGVSEDVALFAGDVMGTAYHATQFVRPGDTVAVLGLGPVGLSAVQTALVAGAAHVVAIDSVEARLDVARQFGATAVHLTEQDPRAEVRGLTGGRGVDVAVEAVGDPVRQFLSADSHELLIGGERVAAADGRTFETPDPSTGERLATVSHAGAQDVDRAVQAARGAFAEGSDWRKMSALDRGRRLAALAQLIDQHADELAQLESLDNGKPVKFARAVDLTGAIAHFDYFAGWPTKIEGDVIPVAGRDMFCYAVREPVGVCGQIIPWNFPLLMAAWKVAPALAAG